MTSQQERRTLSPRSSRAHEKSRIEEAGGERVDKPHPGGGLAQKPRQDRRLRVGGGPENKWIPPKASLYTEFSRDRAEKLATMRRGRLDEFTWAAIGGFAASVPGTARTLSDVLSKQSFSLSLPQFVDLAVTLVFAVLLAVASLSRNRGQTSMEYLDEHFASGSKSKAAADRSIPKWWCVLARVRG